jgi:hypothetical protein
MLHMTCQMQEMYIGKLYIWYKGAPTHPTQEIKHTPSSPCKWVKVAWSRGLVRISASWSCVGTWIKAISPFSTLSLRKWYLTSMCLVLEWSTRFFAMLMALVLKWDMGILLTKVTHGICDPKELRATTSCSNVLCLGSGLSNTRLFARRPKHQRRSQKLASPKSGLPIQPTPGTIRVWTIMKHQRRRRGVPKAEVGSVTQVPKYALDRLPMRSPWRRLKTSAQTYRELDVWSHRRQVEEWPDHAPVLLLVNVFTFLIHIKSYSRTHRRRHGLAVLHLELPHNVLGVLSLVHKYSFLWLLDL